MKIVNEALLDEFRRKEKCEQCGRRKRTGMEPSHIFARGRSSAFRMDVRINLLAQCRDCHQAYHDGNTPRRYLLEIVAKREGRDVDEMELELKRLRWATDDDYPLSR